MAKKSGELRDPQQQADRLDAFAGRTEGTDPFLDRYADEGGTSTMAVASDDEIGSAGLRTENLEMTSAEQPDETEHIRAQIEETRSEMAETIDALQEKLSFSNVSEQVSEHVSHAIETAKDSVYDATIGKAVGFMKNAGDGISNSGVVRTVRGNPLPFLLIGLGTGLLAYQNYSGGGRSRRSSRGNSRYMMSGRHNMMSSHDVGEMATTTGESTSYSTSGGGAGRSSTGRISGAASNAYESVTDAASNVYDGVSQKVSGVYSSAGDVASRAKNVAGEYTEKAYETYDHYRQENPLALGAVALALGAAAGFAIPATNFEGRLMGEARKNVLNRAQDMAGDLVDRAKHVASEAGRTIQDETRGALTQ